MLSPEQVFHDLAANGISFFAGVPDSLLKEFCAYVEVNVPSPNHIIAANEGSAVGLAAGYHLATGRVPLVYMQNSGIGNAVNPLVSLADPDVYGIPMLLLIGWRGEPGRKDEPQHVKQGKVTISLLESLGIPHAVIDKTTPDFGAVVAEACTVMAEKSMPYALVVREGTFSSCCASENETLNYPLTREDAIRIILDGQDRDDVVVSTTGKASREVFEYRKALNRGHCNDFLTVGSMGHCSQIALGIALQKPQRRVWCLDGDGAAIMHAGGMATIGATSPENYCHVILNNGAHESVGGQPTAGFAIDFTGIAKACGYRNFVLAETCEQLIHAVRDLSTLTGPSLLEVRVKKGSRSDLGRPTTSPGDNKRDLMELLRI